MVDFSKILNKIQIIQYYINELTMGKESIMAGQGSTGNVIAALASFFIPVKLVKTPKLR